MYSQWKKIVACAALVMITVMSFAQPSAEESMDIMRSNGKIYVVVAVVITILLGMFVYLVSLDRKISKIEKETKS